MAVFSFNAASPAKKTVVTAPPQGGANGVTPTTTLANGAFANGTGTEDVLQLAFSAKQLASAANIKAISAAVALQGKFPTGFTLKVEKASLKLSGIENLEIYQAGASQEISDDILLLSGSKLTGSLGIKSFQPVSGVINFGDIARGDHAILGVQPDGDSNSILTPGDDGVLTMVGQHGTLHVRFTNTAADDGVGGIQWVYARDAAKPLPMGVKGALENFTVALGDENANAKTFNLSVKIGSPPKSSGGTAQEIPAGLEAQLGAAASLVLTIDERVAELEALAQAQDLNLGLLTSDLLTLRQTVDDLGSAGLSTTFVESVIAQLAGITGTVTAAITAAVNTLESQIKGGVSMDFDTLSEVAAELGRLDRAIKLLDTSTDGRLDVAEAKLAGITGTVTAAITAAVNGLETKIKAGVSMDFDTLAEVAAELGKLDGAIKALDQSTDVRLDAVEPKLAGIVGTVKSYIDGQVEDLQGQIDELVESDVATAAELQTLTSRIDALAELLGKPAQPARGETPAKPATGLFAVVADNAEAIEGLLEAVEDLEQADVDLRSYIDEQLGLVADREAIGNVQIQFVGLTDTGSSQPGAPVTRDNAFGLELQKSAPDSTVVYQQKIGNGNWTDIGSVAPAFTKIPEGTYQFRAQITKGEASAFTNVLSVTVDRTVPVAPSIRSISVDAGASATDGITNDDTLVLNISVANAADAGSEVEVYAVTNTGLEFVGYADETAVSGNYTFDLPTLAEGTHRYVARIDEDLAGNRGGNSQAFVITVDKTAPTLTMIQDDQPGTAADADPTVEYTFTFSERVHGFDADDITVAGGTKGSVTAVGSDGRVYKVVVTASDDSISNLSVTVKQGGFTDTAGNAFAADVTNDLQAVDTRNPTVTITTSNTDGVVSDGFLSTDATATYNLASVNDAPAGADKTVTFNEDATYTFSMGDFGFTDTNDTPANGFAAVKISSLPANGSLNFNGVAITAAQVGAGYEVSVADINANKLTFTPAADANGLNYASFTFQVRDNGGTANGGVNLDQSPNTITFNVTAVNDAPVADAETLIVTESTTATFSLATLLAGDTDIDSTNLSITAVAENSDLISNLVLNQAAGTFSFTTASLTGSADATTSFTYTVSDGNGGTATGTVNLKVKNGIGNGADTVSITNDGAYDAAWLDTQSGNDNVTGGAQADTVIGGSGDDNLAGNGGDDSLEGGAGNDMLFGNGGFDTLVGGTGADTLTGGTESDDFRFAAGDTVLSIGGKEEKGTISGFDVVNGFSLANGTAASETFDTAGTAAVVGNGTDNGTDSSLEVKPGEHEESVKSHKVTNGIITFDDQDTFDAALVLDSASDVAAVVQYLQNNDIGNAGSTVAFTATIGGTARTFVYTQGTNDGVDNSKDVLVDLVGVTATSLTTNAATTTNGALYIA